MLTVDKDRLDALDIEHRRQRQCAVIEVELPPREGMVALFWGKHPGGDENSGIGARHEERHLLKVRKSERRTCRS